MKRQIGGKGRMWRKEGREGEETKRGRKRDECRRRGEHHKNCNTLIVDDRSKYGNGRCPGVTINGTRLEFECTQAK